MNTYGVISKKDGHVDVSKTETGAKRYATRHGYNQVSIRYNGGHVAKIIAEKRNGRWIKPKLNHLNCGFV